MRLRVLVLLVMALFCHAAAAQTLGPEEEASPTLFDLKLGDADVELYAAGAWTMGLQGGIGLDLGTLRSGLTLETFPWPASSWDQTSFPFYIEPDITLSLWLLQRYFFETSILANFDFNAILLGYRGGKDEFLKTVLIGNRDIRMDPYAYAGGSDMPDNSFGLKVLFESERSRHEIMARIEPSEPRSKVFIGYHEAASENIELYAYVAGRLLILPDSGVADLEILLESREGVLTGSDGRAYRPINGSEATVSAELGFIFFDKTPSGRVLVRYTKDGKSVGHPDLGMGVLSGVSAGMLDPQSPAQHFYWDAPSYLGESWETKKVTIEGADYLAIFIPGSFNPFESSNLYAPSLGLPEEKSKISLNRAPKAGDAGEAVAFTVPSGTSLLQIMPYEGGVRNPNNRYPFARSYPSLYGPNKKASAVYADEYLALSVLIPGTGFTLEPGVLEGSVKVRVNGKQEERFTIDYSTGTMTFQFPITFADRIDVSYNVTASQEYALFGAGDAEQSEENGGYSGISSALRLTAGAGNRFILGKGRALGKETILETGISLGWNINRSGYSTADRKDDGVVLLSSGIRVQEERVTAGLDGAVAFTTENTSGILRLVSMEDAGFTLSISKDIGFPSETPGLPADEGGAIILTPSGRGELLYKDYVSYGLFGSGGIMPYTWTPPESQTYDAGLGNPEGPYTAGSGGEVPSAEILVMDYRMPALQNWVGAQLPVFRDGGADEGLGGADFSQVSSINFYARIPGYDGGVKLYLHIGTLGEPPDSSGDSSFSNDLPVIEQPDKILVKDIPIENGDWKSVSILISPAEAALLRSVNGIRFLLVSAADNMTGKVLIGDISFNSSAFRPTQPEPDVLQVRQLPEREMSDTPETYLVRSFPDELSPFFGAAAEGKEGQKVLEASFSGADAQAGAGLLKYLSPVPLFTYRNLVFFYRTPELSSAETAILTLSIAGTDGGGLSASFRPGLSKEWRKVVVDLKRMELYVDGALIPDSVVTLTETKGALPAFTLRITGSDGGTLNADEFYLEKADVSLSGGIKGFVLYENPDFLLQAGPVSILRSLKIYQAVEVISGGFPYIPGPENRSPGFSSVTDMESVFLYSDLGISFEPRWDGERFYLSGGHRLAIPSGDIGSPVSFSDYYSERNSASGSGFSHEEILKISAPKIAGSVFSWGAFYRNGFLNQTWKGELTSLWSIPAYITATAAFGIVSGDYIHSAGAYFDTWISSFRFITPRLTDYASERTFTGTLKTGFDVSGGGLSLTANIGTLASGITERRQDNRLKADVRVPLRIPLPAGDTATIELTYKRNLVHTLPAPYSPLFDDDFMLLGQTFAGQTYFYKAAPFAELFSRRQLEIFTEESEGSPFVEYTPAFALSASRSFGSRITDLFLPSSIKLGIKRDYRRREISADAQSVLSASLVFAALNLFGKVGAYSLTGFYDSDEFTWSAGTDVTLDRDGTLTAADFYLRHYLAFFREPGGLLTVENNFRKSWLTDPGYSEEIILAFAWRAPSDIRIPLDYLKDRGLPYFKNREHLSVTLSPQYTPSASPGINLFLGHETSYVIDDVGFARAFIDIGFDTMRNERYLLGLKGGFEVSLSF